MSDDKVSSSGEPRSPAMGHRSALARCVAQHRAFLDLARVVAGGPLGLWTGALPVLLSPVGAAWGAMYRVAGKALELSASEGLPLALRGGVEAFDLLRHVGFAACRAVRTRRAVIEEKIFAAALDTRAAAGFEAAGLTAGVAVPITHSGAVFGVLIAGVAGIDADALLFLDGASALIAPALALAEGGRPVTVDRRGSDPPRGSAEGGTRASRGGEAEGAKRQEGARGTPGSPQEASRSSSKPPRSSSSKPPRSVVEGGARAGGGEPVGAKRLESARGAAGPPAAPVDAGRAAVEAVQQCTPFLRRTGIDVRIAAEDGLVVDSGGSDLALALAHLVTNGAEAAAERSPGALSPSQPRRVRVSAAREGAAVVVRVDDSGRGVPPDLRARVFEPGFSTKGKNRGSGLALVRRIASAAGGHVEVGVSELGGASFRLVLPASAGRPEQSSSGLWHTGATWPQMHASGRESRPSGERGGDDGESDPVTGVLRRAAS